MILPKELIEKWQVLRSPGDTSKMAEKLDGTDKEIFNRAFREGKCNDDVFQVMAEFYKQKEEKIKEYL